MTAGKDQAQPVVFQGIIEAFLWAPSRRTPLRFQVMHQIALRRIESGSSAQSINGFEAGCRDQPWPRVCGYSTLWPQAQRSGKSFVHRLFGKVKITQQPDQSGQDPSRLHAIQGVKPMAYLLMSLLRGTFGDDALGHETTLANRLPRINSALHRGEHGYRCELS